MKLLDLVVRNVRGVVQLELHPEGKSFVVLGPNGTGKSAIVDAIDFLLTGEMGRFVGRSGFNIREHGRHLKADPQHCLVEARVRLPDFDHDVMLCRTFSNTTKLKVDPESARAALRPFLEVAQQRHYLLTRSNILDFILAQPRTRAEQVQTLLKVGRIERIRQALSSTVNSAAATLGTKRTAVQSSYGAVSMTLSMRAWDVTTAIATINGFRETLGGQAIDSLEEIKKGIEPPTLAAVDPNLHKKQPPTAFEAIASVGMSLSEVTINEIDRADAELIADLKTLVADPSKLKAAHSLELIDMGIRLAAGSDACPLCDRPWEPGALVPYLQDKLDGGKYVKPVWQRASKNARFIMQWLADAEARIAEIIGVGKIGEEGVDPVQLKPYSTMISSLRESLSDYLTGYLVFRDSNLSLSAQLGAEPARSTLRSLYVERKPNTLIDPKQRAWDTLTKAEENLRRLAIDEKTFGIARQSAERVETLHAAFVKSRDKILDGIYASVAERFAQFYRQLHADESTFSAKLAPTDTGLKLSVDFLGMATAMPHTLHSEGHQDSMGFCLWLALSEKMQGDRLEFCLLDDIVMAIDGGHRRQIARLLKSLQPDTQVLLTTHDQTWAQQLRTEKVVSSSTLKRFTGWTLESGPTEGVLLDFITEARDALKKSNVREAAAALRHGLENYFQHVADLIGARVAFSLAGQYELGDLQSACAARINQLIKSGRAAAQSWGQKEAEQNCASLDAERTAASQDAAVEQWAINPNVHYNHWMNMTAVEFEPVVAAFERYCKVFRCVQCDSPLHITYDGTEEAALTCDAACRPVNLKRKK
jgi:recombinational DNA repair ATPase RecF